MEQDEWEDVRKSAPTEGLTDEHSQAETLLAHAWRKNVHGLWYHPALPDVRPMLLAAAYAYATDAEEEE